jgi:hypothetical protein
MKVTQRVRNSFSGGTRWFFAAFGVLFFFRAAALESNRRVALLPRLQSGQTLRFESQARLERRVKTESRVVTILEPQQLQRDLSSVLRLTIGKVRMENGRPIVEAHAELEPVEENRRSNAASANTKMDFTIFGDGQVGRITGLEDLDPEQRLAWQFWVARFSYGWTLPPAGVRPGDRWRSEQLEKTPAPIADLAWERETTYVKNDRCPVLVGETCAIFLTRALLNQKSDPEDTTPEDFRSQNLSTSGTASGTNESITYISLKTGLVLRATEDAQQAMDVTVANADYTNAVHYTIDVDSHFETHIVSPDPSPVP